MVKIFIINPNTSVEMTETIDKSARKYASAETQIDTVNLKDGPEFIANAYHVDIQAPQVIDLVEKNRNSFDSFIIACGLDPGLQACRTITRNVVGIGETALNTACSVSNLFSFLNVLNRGESYMRERMRKIGITPNRCASVRVVGNGIDDEVVRKRHEMIDEYLIVGRKCIEEDNAEALILICAGMSDLKGPLEEKLGIPVICGVVSAVKIVEQFPAFGR